MTTKTKTSSKMLSTSAADTNTSKRGRGRPPVIYSDIAKDVGALIIAMHGKAHTAEEIALAITDKFTNKQGDPLKVCGATVRTYGRKVLNLLWHVGKRRADGTLNAYGSKDAALPLAAAKPAPATKGGRKSGPQTSAKGRQSTGKGRGKGAGNAPATAARSGSQKTRTGQKAKQAKGGTKDSAIAA